MIGDTHTSERTNKQESVVLLLLGLSSLAPRPELTTTMSATEPSGLPCRSDLIYFAFALLNACIALVCRFSQVDLGFPVSGFPIWTEYDLNNNNNTAYVWELPMYQMVCSQNACRGLFATFRFSFAQTVCFLLMALLASFMKLPKLHHSFWFAKLLCVILIYAMASLATNDFFVLYAWVARYFAPIFLLVQVVACIDGKWGSEPCPPCSLICALP